jgi:Domain of unknown function (DUF4440)
MKYFAIAILSIYFITACKDVKTNSFPTAPTNDTSQKYVRVNFKTDFNTPTVGITEFTLITSNLQRDSGYAREIIKAKVLHPLAMQRHDAKFFDSLLAKDFISQGEEEFFNRQEYIQNRVNAKWMISDVRYENIVLEFFGHYGVLTYRNKVKEKDEFGKDQLYLWFWTDIWIKEDGKWKLRVLRALN